MAMIVPAPMLSMEELVVQQYQQARGQADLQLVGTEVQVLPTSQGSDLAVSQGSEAGSISVTPTQPFQLELTQAPGYQSVHPGVPQSAQGLQLPLAAQDQEVPQGSEPEAGYGAQPKAKERPIPYSSQGVLPAQEGCQDVVQEMEDLNLGSTAAMTQEQPRVSPWSQEEL